MKSWFKARENDSEGTCYSQEEALSELCFDDTGLIPVIAQDCESKEVLMFAWMNEESLRETLSTGRMCYWSRSRKSLWRKGETSGHWQQVKSLRTDCDGDVLLAEIEQTGGACHTMRRSCFYWKFEDGQLKLCSKS